MHSMAVKLYLKPSSSRNLWAEEGALSKNRCLV